MKQILLILCLLGGFSFVGAQSVPMGINYQALARNADGNSMQAKDIFIRIALTSSAEEPVVYYLEEHQVTTDQLGLFDLVIGRGEILLGEFIEVPWAKEQIWLNVEMTENTNEPYQLVSSSQMMSVPYAMHALTTDRIVDPEETELRNQSIYWATSGNAKSRPDIHFVGTRDAQDFAIKTNDTTRAVFTSDGQLEIYSGVDGEDNDMDAYPVTVEGSKQGIYIKVNGSRSSDNNFVTFADGSQIWGRIEGQTLQELEDSESFKSQIAVYALQGTSLGLQAVALIAKAAGEAASGFGAGAAAVVVGESAVLLTQVGELTAAATFFENNAKDNVGVSYQSGNGDYAEWLERHPEERDLRAGEVVGVKNGIVSLDTDHADHFMVVSAAPIVLGNSPAKDKEELFERIAFMGQVYVRVAGPVNVGDYIIPSGNKDGLGIALAPEKMLLGDYDQIIGVAWEAGKDGPFNLVKVAVGINKNDLAEKALLLDKRVENIYDYLEGKAPLIEDPSLLTRDGKTDKLPKSQFNKQLSDTEFDAIIDQNAELFERYFSTIGEQLKKQDNLDTENSYFKSAFDNPIQYLKDLRRNPAFETQWSLIDAKFRELIKKQ